MFLASASIAANYFVSMALATIFPGGAKVLVILICYSQMRSPGADKEMPSPNKLL